MDYQQAFAISAAGMEVERTRVDVATMNLANAQTVAGKDGHAYQPLRAVVHAGVQGSGFAHMVASGFGAAPGVSVEPSQDAPRMTYEPGHPLADAKGFVAYPGVDSAHEMLNIMSAMRGYEANVAAMNASRSLALKALDIGGNT